MLRIGNVEWLAENGPMVTRDSIISLIGVGNILSRYISANAPESMDGFVKDVSTGLIEFYSGDFTQKQRVLHLLNTCIVIHAVDEAWDYVYDHICSLLSPIVANSNKRFVEFQFLAIDSVVVWVKQEAVPLAPEMLLFNTIKSEIEDGKYYPPHIRTIIDKAS